MEKISFKPFHLSHLIPLIPFAFGHFSCFECYKNELSTASRFASATPFTVFIEIRIHFQIGAYWIYCLYSLKSANKC